MNLSRLRDGEEMRVVSYGAGALPGALRGAAGWQYI